MYILNIVVFICFQIRKDFLKSGKFTIVNKKQNYVTVINQVTNTKKYEATMMMVATHT